MKDYLKFLMYWWSKTDYGIRVALVILAIIAVFLLCSIMFPEYTGLIFVGLVAGGFGVWLISIIGQAVFKSYKKNRTAFLREQEYEAQRVVDRLAGR